MVSLGIDRSRIERQNQIKYHLFVEFNIPAALATKFAASVAFCEYCPALSQRNLLRNARILTVRWGSKT